MVRDEDDGIRRYCHIGTGNYNSKTARLYEDLGLLTADPEPSAPTSPSCSTTSPATGATSTTASCSWPRRAMRPAIEALIHGEMSAPEGTGRIIMKMNSLVDAGHDRRAVRGVARAAWRSTWWCGASAACDPACPGCRRRSGSVRSSVATWSTRASTTSPTGRGSGCRPATSARPTSCPATSTVASRRWCPCSIRRCRPGCRRCSTSTCADDTLAWTLGPDGQWTHVPRGGTINTHTELRRLAVARTRRGAVDAVG